MTNAPTDELRQHHDVEDPRVDARAFRQGWIIRTRLDQLLADDRITPGEWQAASDFRTAWLSANAAASAGPALARVAGSADPDAAMIERLAAAAKVRNVSTRIGPLATALVNASVCRDLSWASIGRYIGRNPETVRDWTVLAIRKLALAWGGPGRRPSSRSDQQDRGRARAV